MDIDALVAAAQYKSGCWVTRLTGESRDFMEAITTAVAAGEKFSPSVVHATVVQLGGVPPKHATVGHHINQKCACWT
jgi:hypothetical protein